MDWSHIFFGDLKVIFLVLGLFDGMFTLLLSFVFKNGHKVFDVNNVCFCLILLFSLTRFLNIGISQQSNASILLQ